MPSALSAMHQASERHLDTTTRQLRMDFDTIRHPIGVPSLPFTPTALNTPMPGSRSRSHSGDYNPGTSYSWGPSNNSTSSDQYAPRPGMTMVDLYDASVMGDSFLGVPSRFSGVQQDFDTYEDLTYSLSDSTSPSPEADSDGGHSPPTHHLSHDSHDAITPVYGLLGTGFPTGDMYADTRQSFNGYPTSQPKGNTWGYPASVPFISQSTRAGMVPSRSPIEQPSYLLQAFAQSPTLGDPRRWPQMFKVNQAKKMSPKKQVLACLFCRERKIGCMRPPEDHPDQTCNQCVRRKRTCVYPSESRRGHHARNRMSARKFLGLDEPSDSVPASESPPE